MGKVNFRLTEGEQVTSHGYGKVGALMIDMQTRLDTLRADMLAAYTHKHSAEEINAKLDEVIAHHLEHSAVKSFIPVMVEREVTDYFGRHRVHVRFAGGPHPELAEAAVALTRKHADDAIEVDTVNVHSVAAPGADENLESVAHTNAAHATAAQENGGRGQSVSERTVTIPDYIVYLGRDIERQEAGHDVKIWDLPKIESGQESRELKDDLEARVLYMLNRLGIKPLKEREEVKA